MSKKTLIWIGVFVGSLIGGAVPLLWGASPLSLWSVLLSGVGGVAGIWFGIKFGE